MANLNVPERYREGIAKIGEISEEGFVQLRDALSKAPSCRNSTELAAWVSTETPAIESADREAILTSLAPMFRVQKNAEVTGKVFASDVWKSLKASSPELVSSFSEHQLRSRLSELIEQNALDMPSTRIADLRSEVERIFCRARILTDLRPAFKTDVEDPPSEMALIHTLQIGYHDGLADHKEFYVSMDEYDIKKLKKVLDRALAKSRTLEKTFEKSKINLHK